MMKAKGGLLFGGQALPMGTRRFQHHIGAGDVGLDEGRRPVDRTVHMGLGGEMHHRVRPVPGEDGGDRRGIGDVGLLMHMPGMAQRLFERVRARRIGQLVEIDDLGVGAPDEEADIGRADEAEAAGDKDFHGRRPSGKARDGSGRTQARMAGDATPPLRSTQDTGTMESLR